MKKILILVSVIIIGFGCKKVETTTPIGANEGTTTIKFSIATPTSSYPKISYSPNGAPEEFLSLSDNGIKVKFEAPTVAPSDIYIEYKINAAGLTKLNADALAKDPAYKAFVLLPDSTFKIMVTKDTIRKGQQYAEKVNDNIVVYTQKIDPSINYILPLTVTNSTYPSAVGTGTIYYYIIGNPISGPYTERWIRWNNLTGTGTPTFDVQNLANSFTPTGPTEVEVQSQGNGLVYIIDFVDNGGTLTNFTVTVDPASYPSAALANIVSGPTIIADPIAKKYIVNFSYNNTTGGGRTVSDTFQR
jgi:hypothetical protein